MGKLYVTPFYMKEGGPTQGHTLVNSRFRTNERSVRIFPTSLMPAKIMHGISIITVIQNMVSETRLFGFKS